MIGQAQPDVGSQACTKFVLDNLELETDMNDLSFTTTFTVDQTPAEAFAAITNVRGWWGEGVQGGTEKLGDEFVYRHHDIHYTKFRLTEVVPAKRVTWLALDAYISFAEDKAEWTGTTVVFDITEKEGKTEVRFTHVGLVPAFGCFENCSMGWGYYVNGSLQSLITTGRGNPDPKDVNPAFASAGGA